MKKICIVTATRAEYGLLRNIIDIIHHDESLQLCLIVTGTHLSSEFGTTISEIIADGYPITEKIDILMSSDNPQSVSKTMGIASISFADVFNRENPDMLIVLGDRYELLPICSAALNAHIPIAHISGGEVTEGAIDDCIRHCISKLSYLHFPACETYRSRIIQLGESPDRVFNFGDVGVENIHKMNFIPKSELADSIGLSLSKPYMCVTFHPTTLEEDTVLQQCNELFEAVATFSNMDFIFTKSNADAGGRTINDLLDNFVSQTANCFAFSSLGLSRYLALMKYSKGVIGNSSSGIVEAPSLHIPTINIGDRQAGRLQASSIINCLPIKNDIVHAIQKATSKEFACIVKHTENPYGAGNTAYNIVNTIRDFLENDKINLKKSFYDIIKKDN